jgi:cbb3-type cytochrome oxidase subunit 1
MNNNSHYTDSATVFLIFCTMIWAIIGMSAGAYLASELVMPWLNFDIAPFKFSVFLSTGITH